jgi:hypothetical protein
MPLSDRRLGRISVQTLRRDLREADEDRFRLTSALMLRKSSNGIIGVLFLLIAGFASALWTSRGPAPAVELVSAASPEWLEPPVVAQSRRVNEPAAVDTPKAKPPRRRTRHLVSGSRSQQPVRMRTVERPRPPVARPLHPGEFGRLTSRPVDRRAVTAR